MGRRIARSERSLPQHLHGQVGQQERQPVQVVAGIGHEQDRRVAVLPLPRLGQPFDDLAQLDGSDRQDIGAGLQADRVQQRLRSPRRCWGVPGNESPVLRQFIEGLGVRSQSSRPVPRPNVRILTVRAAP
ncbi:hypothetical protein [Nonomuraea sp. NPDC049709]|uniref:hypothetical protein n=1 Tax=Nonomuraea sp. NPDC049709 TaxID=3154736 RepID=UPI00343F2044